jgi:hypothetical protein
MIFDASDHSYIHDGVRYKSATSLLKLYEADKDWQKIAEAYAKKNGNTAEHWRDVWDQNRDRSAERGTLYHYNREQDLISKGAIVCPEIDGKKHAIDLDNLEGLYSELIIFDPYFKVAGTSDVVLVENKKVWITDFKTTESVSSTPKMFWVKEAGRAKMVKYKVPWSSIAETDINKYMLQLSIYGFMLERRGYEIMGLKIEQVVYENPKGPVEDQEVKEIITHDIQYSKVLAKAGLDYFRRTSQLKNKA